MGIFKRLIEGPCEKCESLEKSVALLQAQLSRKSKNEKRGQAQEMYEYVQTATPSNFRVYYFVGDEVRIDDPRVLAQITISKWEDIKKTLVYNITRDDDLEELQGQMMKDIADWMTPNDPFPPMTTGSL